MAQNPPPINVIIAAQDNTRAAVESAKTGFNSLRASATALTGVFAAATAALAGLTIVNKFQDFVAGAAAMDDLAEKTGASVEQLSALAGVAKISGVQLDVVEGALIKLAKGLAGADEESKGAGNALAALGLQAEKLKGLDTAESLKIVADQLNQYKDGAGKTALAIDLLGKSGAQALPFLKDLAETQKLQARLTAEQAAQAENLEKNLVRLSASTSGAWKEFSAAVLPVVDTFVTALLEAQNKTGGLRDEIKKLSADGTLEAWARNTAIGAAYVVDAFKTTLHSLNVLRAEIPVFASAFELAFEKIRGINRSTPVQDIILNRIRREKEQAEAALGAAAAKFAERGSFVDQLRGAFKKLDENRAGSEGDEGDFGRKRELKYTSTVDKAGKQAKDELKAIDTYVASIREQLVGATEGEFEKMRQKALDVFGQVDFKSLNAGDRRKFADFFAQVTEDIDALEEKSRNMAWGKALAEQFTQAGAAAEKADEAFARFNEQTSQQAQDLQFEIEMVGKLASERQKLAAARRIDLDAQRAVATVPDNAPNRDERINDIIEASARAKQQVGSLYEQLRTQSREGFAGLQSAASEYFDRISNDAENFKTLFNDAFRSMEDVFVQFATTGKASSKSLIDAIIGDLARLTVRQNITGPLAEGLKSALGSGGMLDGFLNLFKSKSSASSADLDQLGVGLPSFAVGTDYVPRDMIAQIHKGERIVPAGQNAGGGGGISIVNHITVGDGVSFSQVAAAMDQTKRATIAAIGDAYARNGAKGMAAALAGA